MTSDLIKGLEDRIESVEDSIRQVGECLFQLQRAHRSKWGPLNVSERRLEIRDGRPLQELVRDHVQSALEHERQTLIESRQELADQIQVCKETLISLDELKSKLLLDLSHKRHGLRIDRSCLSPGRPIGQGPNKEQERLVLPQVTHVAFYTSPPSPRGAERGSGDRRETGRQMDTRSLIQLAVKMEEEAMQLCNESDAVMLHTKRECASANAESMTCLARRVDETDDLRRQLEQQLSETASAISHTERSITKTMKKLKDHEQPLRILDKQFDLRNKRTSREGIRDPVTEELESHLETVKSAVKMHTTKWQSMNDVLQQLKSSKLRIVEDLRCKTLAQRIDDTCVKMTARKAIELDRMDPRGGRVRETGRKPRQMQLESSLLCDSF